MENEIKAKNWKSMESDPIDCDPIDFGKIAASSPADVFALNALTDKSTIEPLWLGFVEKYEDIQQKVDLNLLGYLVLLPPDSIRHIDYSHGNDGGNQRPILPKDFTVVAEVVNNFDDVRLGDTSRHDEPTLVFTKTVANESYRLVFQVLKGKRNKSLQLISMVIKLIKK
jgi:hypothetical protein